MMTRLVKLPIKQEKTHEFRHLFESIKETIKGFEGCIHLELFSENTNSGVHFTFSIWESENDLNKYRQSEFFKKTWATTKTLLADKPDAWSLEKI